MNFSYQKIEVLLFESINYTSSDAFPIKYKYFAIKLSSTMNRLDEPLRIGIGTNVFDYDSRPKFDNVFSVLQSDCFNYITCDGAFSNRKRINRYFVPFNLSVWLVFLFSLFALFITLVLLFNKQFLVLTNKEPSGKIH